GPNADYWKDAAYGVTTEADARAAVRELAGKNVNIVKIWVDERKNSVRPPRFLVMPNRPDPPPSIAELEWLSETYPARAIEELKKTAVASPARPRLFEPQGRSLAKLTAAG